MEGERWSKLLAESIAESFTAEKGLLEDGGGVTIGMRGYYAFSYRRFEHTISPFTPAVVLELGFITNAEERRSLSTQPEYWAGLVLRGLETYIAAEDRSRVADFRPVVYPWVAAKDDSTYARDGASGYARKLWPLQVGKAMMPVDESGDSLDIPAPAARDGLGPQVRPRAGAGAMPAILLSRADLSWPTVSYIGGMDKRRLGKSGIEVTPIGLGTWQFSKGKGFAGAFWKSLDDDTTKGVVKAALDGGIDWFDTAELYGWGNSERNLAAALSSLGVAPGSVRVATKWWPLGQGPAASAPPSANGSSASPPTLSISTRSTSPTASRA